MDIFGRYNLTISKATGSVNTDYVKGGISKGEINMEKYKIINLGTPVDATDASTKLYTDQQVINKATEVLKIANDNLNRFRDGKLSMNGDLDMNQNKIINLPIDNDISTKLYIDELVNKKSTEVLKIANDNLNRFRDGLLPMKGDLDMNQNKIINLANPENDSDGVNYKTLKNDLDLKMDKQLITAKGEIFGINNGYSNIEPSWGDFIDPEVNQSNSSDNLGHYKKINENTRAVLLDYNFNDEYYFKSVNIFPRPDHIDRSSTLFIIFYYKNEIVFTTDKGAKKHELNNILSDRFQLVFDTVPSHVQFDYVQFEYNFTVDKNYVDDEIYNKLASASNRFKGLVNDRILRVFEGKLRGGETLVLDSIDTSIYNFFLVEFILHNSFNAGIKPIRDGDTLLTGYLDSIFSDNTRFEIGALRINYSEDTRELRPFFSYRHSEDWKTTNHRNKNDVYYISKIFVI